MNIESKTNLKFISWNIQSSVSPAGCKFEDSSFTSIMNNHDIVCLQETRQAVKMKNFRSLCSTRPNMKSGGVAILYSNSLIGGVEQVRNVAKDNPDIIICKLKRSFFKLNDDFYVINVYVKPDNSSNKTLSPPGRDTLKQAEEISNKLRASGQVILAGDFNARIGNHSGLVTHDTNNSHVPLPHDYLPDTFTPRNSNDTHTNSFGKDFIQLVINNSLTILNGRVLGDLLPVKK